MQYFYNTVKYTFISVLSLTNSSNNNNTTSLSFEQEQRQPGWDTKLPQCYCFSPRHFCHRLGSLLRKCCRHFSRLFSKCMCDWS